MIVDSKLWKVSSKASNCVTRTECIPVSLGFEIVLDAHMANGCFSPEHTQLHLCNSYFWPGMFTDS